MVARSRIRWSLAGLLVSLALSLALLAASAQAMSQPDLFSLDAKRGTFSLGPCYRLPFVALWATKDNRPARTEALARLTHTKCGECGERGFAD